MISKTPKNLLGRKIAIIAILLLFGSALAIWLYERPRDRKLISQSETRAGSGREDGDEDEKEDGIRAAQEQEFEMTKDVSLGYIPLDRLATADNDLMTARRNGTYSSRVDALTWTERGSNSDVAGPFGNSRGTQAATDAVTSGRMRAIWVDLTSPTVVWAGGVDGGIWKSTNIASTSAAVWSPVNDQLGNLAIASICQSPANTNIMYFGTGEKTFNADAVRGGGIWKSTDHGVTWNLLGSTTTFTNISRVLCDAAGNVYAANINPSSALGSVRRSTDGGTTWTDITPSGLTAGCTEMRISSTGRLHVVCGYIGAGTSGYRYTDIPATVASGTWTTPVTTFPTSENSELAVGGTGSTLYALPANGSDLTPTIYKSTDGGANWAATASSPPSTASEPSINTGQGWYDLAIGVDPTNDNNVIAGGLNFYRTTDGGMNWSQITRWVGNALPYVHADHHAVVWTTSQILVGSDGGLFYSNDGGTTWSDRNDGLRLKQFYSCAIHPSSTNYFLAGAQDNGTHQFNGAGLTSSTEVVGGDGAFAHIDQDEPQYQFGAYVFAQYRRSTDGGSTWANVNFSGSNSYQFINPTDYDDVGNIMYTAGLANQYIRWDNPQTGATFNTITVAAFNSSRPTSMIVSPYTPNRVFFGTQGGRVVKVDNANTATPTATNITQAGMSASTVSCVAIGTDDNNLLATFSNYGAAHVWVSTNGGTSWTNISGTGLPDIPVRWAMFYPEDNTKAIIATEMGIYETNLINGGTTAWAQDNSFPVVRTDMLQFRKSDGLVLAATHGRGLWSATIPSTPYIRFATSSTSKPEATASTSTCRNYTDYSVNMTIDAAPTGTATVTLSIAGGGTATQGIDYDFTTNGNFAAPTNTLTFASGSTTPQPITVRVYNDAEIESTESFTFNYLVSGATNALAAPSSPSFTFNITDNDAAPVVGSAPVTNTIGTNNTSLSQPFRAEFTDARTQMVYLASELTAAGFSAGTISSVGLNVVSKVSTGTFDGFTIKMKNTATSTLTGGGVPFESGATPVFGPVSYATTAGLNTFTLSSAFVWDGTSNVLVDICFDNAATIGLSADLVAGTSGTATEQHDRQSGAGISGCTLTNANLTFVGNARPVMTFTITPADNQIETVLNNNRSEYIGSNGTFYFYNGTNIINRLSGVSANLGCVNSNIFAAGNTWQSFQGGLRSQKVFDITPTTNSGATYTVGLYFTAAELSTYSSTPGTLRIAKTTAATMAAANSSNTIIAGTTTFAAFGTGYVFTATFSGFSKFFLVDPSVTLPITLLTFDGRLDKKTIPLTWTTAQELNSSYFEIEKSTDGSNFHDLAKVGAAGSSFVQRDYHYVDVKVNELNYYRLKMVDIDGRFEYSKTILIKNPDAIQSMWVVNNPFTSYIDLRFAKMPKQAITVELLNVAGSRMYFKEFGAADQLRLDVSSVQLNRGVYVLKAMVDGRQYISKVQKE